MVRLKSYSIELILVAILMAAVGFFGYLGYGLIDAQNVDARFSGEDALQDAMAQVAFGPRIVGTEESAEAQYWLVRELEAADWPSTIQPFYYPPPPDVMPATTVFTRTEAVDTPMVLAGNIIAASTRQVAPGAPVIWLLAPYDTRLWADADPDPARQQEPTPGANGGASGPAVLLELARSLDRSALAARVCIVLLDAEANRGLPGWRDLTGIDYFLRAANDVAVCANPEFAVVLDLVGGENQQIYIERNSDPTLSAAIWATAERLGHGDAIIGEPKWQIAGIHTALKASGVPTVAMIDYDYAYRATTEDAIDKLSAESFARVGETLVAWLEGGALTEVE